MKKFLFILSVVVLLLAGATGTTTGLRWLIAAADRVMPGELAVSRAGGSLLGPLDLEGVRYRDDAVELRIDSLELDWRPAALFKATVHVDYLHAAGIDLQQLAAPQQQAAEPLSLQPLPFAVTLRDVSLASISVLGYGAAEPVVADRLQLAVTGRGSALQVQTFSLDAPLFAARVQGRLSLEPQQESTLDTDWWLQLAELPKLTGTGSLQGSVQQLNIRQDISGPASVALRGTLTDLLGQPGWTASVDLSGFNLQLLQPQGPERVLSATLNGGGGLESFSLQGRAGLTDPAFGVIDAELQLSRAADRWRLQRLDLRNPQYPGELRIDAEYSSAGELSARAGWRELAWKISEQQSLRSPSGELRLEGRLDDYRFEGNGLLDSTGYPQLALQTQGTGNRQRLQLQRVQGESAQGSFDATGSFAWQPALQWTLRAALRDFDPAFFVPGRSGKLSFRLQSEGSRLDTGLQGQLLIDEVGGNLQGQPVSGRTDATISGTRVEIAEAFFAAGSNRVSASGSLDEEWNLQWRVATGDPGMLLPGARGGLQGQGSLSGPRDTPRITASLDGRDLHLQDLDLRSLQARVDLDLADRRVSKIDLKAGGIAARGQAVDSLAVLVDGKLSAHAIQFDLQQDTWRLDGNLAAALQGQTWAGTLEGLRVRASDTHAWALQQPAGFSVARGRGAVKELCLVQADARLCGAADWQEGGWTASLDGENLALALLEPWLQPGLALDGAAGLQLRGGSGGNGPQGTARLSLAPGSITLDDGEETLVLATFGEGRLDARLENNQLAGELDLPLQESGGISGQLRLGNVASAAGWFSAQTTLASTFRLQLADNGLLALFVPDISTSKGRLDGDLAIGGTLGNPLFRGSAGLKDAELSLPRPGIRLTDMNMQVDGDGNTLALRGSLTSGGGTASYQGQLLLQPGAPLSMDLAISGDDVQLLNMPQATLSASPDLKLALRQQRLDVSGEVHVPRAQIQLREQKGVAKESVDLVLADEQEVTAAAGQFQVYSRVSLVLGDEVGFSGFGLNGKIQGKLEILEDPGKATRGQGELNIVDGNYKLYGQQLDIEKGRLVFTGGPVANPGLDMRVIRQTGELLAGVRITGTADAPQLNLFSDPAMEQSDMLSYLLLGIPTGKASGGQAALLSGAATSLGLSGGELLARKLGDAFGLEEVYIDSGDTLEESSLVLGKYLSPRMYVGYAVGLFDQSNIFRLRYTLSRRWSVQTEAGAASGADLLYSLEND